MKRRLQFTDTSLTTMPPGEETLCSTVKGVFDAENVDKVCYLLLTHTRF